MTATARTRPRALLIGAALGGMLLTCQPAFAATDQLRSVQVHGEQVNFVLGSSSVPAAGALKVTVRIDGQPVPATVTAVHPRAVTTVARRAVLLIDTSGSMKGPGIAGAKAAAVAYLAQVPTDVLVGLTSFDSAVHPLVAPTIDRVALRKAVLGLTAQGETALNDGVLSAIRTLGSDGQRRIVLLSDGADSVSSAPLAAAVSALRAAQVQFSAVQFGSDTSANPALKQLAAVQGDRLVTTADPATLTAAFAEVAQTFAADLDITATLPARATGQTVELSATVGGSSASQRLAVPAAAVPVPVNQRWFGSRTSLPWAAAAVFLGLLALLLVAVKTGGSPADATRKTRRVLARYSLLPRAQKAPEPSVLGESVVARSALELAGRVTQRRGLEERLTKKLDQAALPMRANEWVLMQFLISVVAVALTYALTTNLILGLLLGLLLGVLGPRKFLSYRIGRRQRAFLAALPDSLQLMAGGLSSGYSLPQALDTVVREGSQPIAGELGRALSEARIGVPIEDALDTLADRMDCEDFRWVVMAIRVQHEVGGNLSEVLGTVATTMRERARIRRQVRTLSAEGRLSAWILIGLPVLLGLYQYAFRGDYFRPMYTTTAGLVMLTLTAVSMTVGALWMNKLVKVEV